VRVLALDHGAARCGCAVSDPTGTLATPLEPVLAPDTRRGLARVVDLVAEREVARVLVGLPLRMDGSEGAQAVLARAFAARLAERVARLGVEVELWDERWTTAQARRVGGAASEDSRAAAHLLEAWLAARD